MTKLQNLGMAIMASAMLIPAAAAPAQEFGETAGDSSQSSLDDSLYREPASRAPAPTLARQKAIARGEQRMARLEALRWYGFSNSRPTASAMPFTTMYSPAWQQPGGRPFAWYTSSRPILILSPVYR
jgi:hypothetical protein